jgi:CrcB protein
MTLVLVMLGAAVGAPMRYLADRAVQSRHDTGFPWGTFTVNVVASLVLGLITGSALAGSAPHDVQVFLGTGLCGALSTYSTFSYESMRLAEQGRRVFAAANIAASVIASLGAAFLGVALAQAAWS